jgi:hypothetical protein
MFWVTPSGFILLLHIFLFDKTPTAPFDASSCAAKSTKSSRAYLLDVPSAADILRPHLPAKVRFGAALELPSQSTIDAHMHALIEYKDEFLWDLICSFFLGSGKSQGSRFVDTGPLVGD